MNIEEYLARKKELETILKKEGKGAIMDFIGSFLEESQEIKAIRWTQYTPYFNDGDACVFQLGTVFYLTREPTQEDFDRDPWDDEMDSDEADKPGWLSSYDSTLPKTMEKKLSVFEKKLDKLEDMLESVFGDHVEVTVFKNEAGVIKTKVSEYEHD